jgi:hypothetical protein
MAALNRPTQATYEIHESVKVDTSDNEDHTFCGIMFPIKAKAVLPMERVLIRSIAVRGQLGPLTVWITKPEASPDDHQTYTFRLNARHWDKVYDHTLPSSQRTYQTLHLDPPIELRPGQVRALYIHSTLPGDEAIVYDNSYPTARRPARPRYEDSMITIFSGKAHLSPTPFGQMPIWGWGNAWRDHREFVGQIEYGAVFQLWNPACHGNFGTEFDQCVQAMLACQRRNESPICRLPDECLYYILNMCRWDWFRDTSDGIKAVKRFRRRQRRELESEVARLRAEQAEQNRLNAENPTGRRSAESDSDMYYDAEEEIEDSAAMDTSNHCSNRAGVAAQALAAVPEISETHSGDADDDEGNQGDVEDVEDDDDDEEWNEDEEENEDDEDDLDDDGNESDESEWERANGYRADNTVFTYRDVSSDEESEGDEARTAAERQAWFRRHFARIHILRALARGNDGTGENMQM